MHPRRHDPQRQEGMLLGAKRLAVIAECDALLAEIDQVDTELAALAARRHKLVRALKKRRTRLMPTLRKANRGRQPHPDGTVRLPPLRQACTPLWGRRLRSTCMTLLRRAGPLSLAELHALLHHHGYRVDAAQPIRALSDAMAYEVEQGRADRVERGVYAPIGGASGPRPPGPRTPAEPPGTRLEHLPDAISPYAA